MNKELKVIACIFAVLIVLNISSLILSAIDRRETKTTSHTEIDRFCGTITYRDGSVESIKMVISDQDDKMTFDFRSNPDMLILHRCGEGE